MGVAITGFRTKDSNGSSSPDPRPSERVGVYVSGNRRVTFTCAGKDMDRVDYEDRH